MRYLLEPEEYEDMTAGMTRRDEALEILRRHIVSNDRCRQMNRDGDCEACPLEKISQNTTGISELICNKIRRYGNKKVSI